MIYIVSHRQLSSSVAYEKMIRKQYCESAVPKPGDSLFNTSGSVESKAVDSDTASAFANHFILHITKGTMNIVFNNSDFLPSSVTKIKCVS